MSINHRERFERVVDKALKGAAMGEPYGFTVSGPAFWPFLDAKGEVSGQGPAWFVVVTVRSAGLGEPDIYHGYPAPGILPDDESFRTVALALLEACRRDRNNANAKAMQAFGPSMKLSERPA